MHKVTIIPRGQSLGLTTYLPIDERHNYSRSYSDAVLTYALGGRVAEKIVFGEVSSGGQQDYKMATDLARRMVCDWGMSEKLGPISYGNRQDEVFLGREMAQRRDFSEKVAQVIDDEIRSFVLTAEERAESLLRENIAQVHVLADALLEFEVLDDSQLDRILAGEKLQKPPEPSESHNGRPKQEAAVDTEDSEPTAAEEGTAESKEASDNDT